MSHVVTIKTEVRDVVAAGAACNRLKLAPPSEGRAQLFSGAAIGLIVQLSDWQYPVVFDTSTGEARYDNYNGRWGEQIHLDRFLQIYAVEKSKIETRRNGHTITERTLTDGSIKLTVQIGGAA